MKLNPDMGFDSDDWFEVVAKLETIDDIEERKRILDEYSERLLARMFIED